MPTPPKAYDKHDCCAARWMRFIKKCLSELAYDWSGSAHFCLKVWDVVMFLSMTHGQQMWCVAAEEFVEKGSTFGSVAVKLPLEVNTLLSILADIHRRWLSALPQLPLQCSIYILGWRCESFQKAIVTTELPLGDP